MLEKDTTGDHAGERIAIELSALRRLADADSARARIELPARLGALVAEAGGDCAVELTVMSADDGMIATTLTATGDDTTATEIAVAVTDLIAPIAELRDVKPYDRDSVTEWALALDTSRDRFGFAIADTRSARIDFRGQALSSLDALFTELSQTPNTGVRATLRSVGGINRQFEVRLSVLTRSVHPPLSVRAVVRQRFPGLSITETPGTAEWITIGADDLPRVLPIPVAGRDPLPGTYTGSAAAIPASRQRPSPADTAAGGIRIGHAVTSSGQMIPVALSAQERLRHLHVLGRTGTGKSSALAGLIYELAAAGSEGALVLDPHGHLIDRVLAELPAEAAARTWVIRCGDVTNPVPLSTLAESDPVRRDIAIDATCAIFQELFDSKDTGIVGPRFRERVAMGMRALIALHGTAASLLDVPVILGNELLMDEVAASTFDHRLQAWWANDKVSSRSTERGEVVSWVNSKFEAFAATAAVRGVLGSGHDAIDFAAAMDDRRIILVDLSKADLGEPASRLLGYLYLNRAWEGALRRRYPQQPFTIVVDEAQTLIAGALTTMLSEGRKFGLSVVLANQFLQQLGDALRPAIDGNVATTLAFRSAVADTTELYTRFGGQIDPAVLTTLPNLSAITLRTAGEVGATPHTVMIDHNERSRTRTGDTLGSVTRQVRDATIADLVEPHRAVTAAAAAGRSRIATTANELARQRASRRQARTRVDEWLANRPPTVPPSPRPPSADPADGDEASA